MKIVIAMDSFKGTLKAHEASMVVSNVITKLLSDATIMIKPMADGGEGTARAMIEASNGLWIPGAAMGPLKHMQVEAGFACQVFCRFGKFGDPTRRCKKEKFPAIPLVSQLPRGSIRSLSEDSISVTGCLYTADFGQKLEDTAMR